MVLRSGGAVTDRIGRVRAAYPQRVCRAGCAVRLLQEKGSASADGGPAGGAVLCEERGRVFSSDGRGVASLGTNAHFTVAAQRLPDASLRVQRK